MGATPSSEEREWLDTDYAQEVVDDKGETVWRCKDAADFGGLIGWEGDESVVSLYDSFAV